MARKMPPDRLLVQFVAEFMRDEALRCKVLFNEKVEPKNWGLDQDQVDIINSYDPDLILCEMYKELLASGVDVVRKEKENNGDSNAPNTPLPDCEAGNDLKLMLASAYQAGAIHGRKLDRPSIPANTPTDVTILGNGFDIPTIEVRFTQTDEQPVQPTIDAKSCDVDLYQRLTVNVTLPPGKANKWRVQFRNKNTDQWTDGDRPLDLAIT